MLFQNLPFGDFGTQTTLRKMRQLVNSSLLDPVVIQTARKMALSTFARDKDGQILAIRSFLVDHFQFVQDPIGVELLVTPRAMLETINRRGVVSGDCDEAAVLGATLGKAIGIPAAFVTLGFRGPSGPLSHVYAILRGGSGWVSLDVTKPLRGPFPPATRQETVEV